MAERPRRIIDIRDFLGLVTRADPEDVRSGAATEQVNVISEPGELVVRDALKQITFEEE